MNVKHVPMISFSPCAAVRRGGMVLIIVLWIAFGLVSIALYFGQSMSFNLQAADNYEAGLEADQAIEGGVRYVGSIMTRLQQQALAEGTNMPGIIVTASSLQCYMPESGTIPYVQVYQSDEVPVGSARFWFIGRDSGGTSNLTSDVPVFGLVDEASKLNLNTASLEMLEALPSMLPEVAASILNWRNSSNKVAEGGAELEYATLNPPYSCKNAPFETVDELRLVMGMSTDILYGADVNMNGILDPNENGQGTIQAGSALDSSVNQGILDYVTVVSREPNLRADGTPRININGTGRQQLPALFDKAFGPKRAGQIIQKLTPGAVIYKSVLEIYARSGMTTEEFAKVADDLTTTTNSFITGLVNINTAPSPVLACLPGIGTTNAQALIAYRQVHTDQLVTVAWLGQAIPPAAALQAGPYVTTRSYQFSADIAAVGHYGRGYRRTLFIFDTSSGTPQVIYRRDLGALGWSLGNMRQKWQLAENTP